MKKIFNYLLILAALVSFASCESEEVFFEYAENNPGATFPYSKAKVEMTAEDGNKVQAELWRGNTKGAASVPVTIEMSDNAEGLFTASKASFDFADGEAIAYLTFNYSDINALSSTETYTFKISISSEAQTAVSGIASMTINAARKLTKTVIDKGWYYSDITGEENACNLINIEELGVYAFENAHGEGVDIQFDIVNGDLVWITTDTGVLYSASYGNFLIEPEEFYYDPDKNALVLETGYGLPGIPGAFGNGYYEIYYGSDSFDISMIK